MWHKDPRQGPFSYLWAGLPWIHVLLGLLGHLLWGSPQRPCSLPPQQYITAYSITSQLLVNKLLYAVNHLLKYCMDPYDVRCSIMHWMWWIYVYWTRVYNKTRAWRPQQGSAPRPTRQGCTDYPLDGTTFTTGPWLQTDQSCVSLVFWSEISRFCS